MHAIRLGCSLILIAAVTACEQAPSPTAPGNATHPRLEVSGAGAQAADGTLTLSSVSVGVQHVCGLGTAGQLYCWGSGYYSTPSPVPRGRPSTTVGAGFDFTCAIASSQATMCWGTNRVGELGNGTRTSTTFPRRVTGSTIFTQLGAGRDHTCAVSNTGAAFCWGSNIYGQLGTGSFGGPEMCGSLACSTVPVAVTGGVTFSEVHATDSFSCGLSSGGQAYCWGSNGVGQLGTGDYISSASPVAVTGGLIFTDLDVGFGISCALTGDGTPYCWGSDPNGVPCGPFGTNRCTPTPYVVPGGFHFTRIAAGGYHVCGITAANAAYCWGSNYWGNLGNGTTAGSDTPVPVSGGIAFALLSLNESNTCGVATDGTTYCWGSNEAGQLGIGTNSGPEDCGAFGPCSTVPVAVLPVIYPPARM